MKKHYSANFKAQIVEEILKEEKTLGQLATQHKVHPSQLTKWKAVALKGLPGLFEQKHASAENAAYEGKITELYAEIGRLTTQLNWLKKKSGIHME